MKIFNPTLTEKQNRLWIGFYTMAEPKKDYYGNGTTGIHQYILDNKVWKESFKELPVHESAVDEMKNKAVFIWRKTITKLIANDFRDTLSKGISLDSIKERLEIKCNGCDRDYFNLIGEGYLACCPDSNYQFHLKPLLEQEETQESMIYDIIDLIEKGFGYETIKLNFKLTRINK